MAPLRPVGGAAEIARLRRCSRQQRAPIPSPVDRNGNAATEPVISRFNSQSRVTTDRSRWPR
jgi:hypothetical protein